MQVVTYVDNLNIIKLPNSNGKTGGQPYSETIQVSEYSLTYTIISWHWNFETLIRLSAGYNINEGYDETRKGNTFFPVYSSVYSKADKIIVKSER